MLKKLLTAATAIALISSSAMAQGISQKAASQQDLRRYQYMAGLNVCILTQKGIPFKDAFPASNAMISITIMQVNGGEIIDGDKTIKLTQEQVENGGVPGMAGFVDGIGGKNLKGADKTEFDALKAQIKKYIESVNGTKK